jgi:hypothetical protein
VDLQSSLGNCSTSLGSRLTSDDEKTTVNNLGEPILPSVISDESGFSEIYSSFPATGGIGTV